ncbi:MAG: phenylacetic acid degradation protein PaaD [Rhodobacteraceae bacterium]|nr:MAG: phenylacetic acid degradation protein PaaD [Paracoccaceae bacterium]
MNHLGIERLKTGSGSCELQMTVRAEHLNFNGTVHGGAIFSLADSAFGLASNSHGILSAGIDAHMTYQAAALKGEVLTATASEVSRSRKIAVYRIEVTNQAGEIVAGFTGTVYRTGKPNYKVAED